MSIYELKPRFQALLRPMVAGCASLGISANMVTTAALLLSFLWGYFFLAFPDAVWVFVSLPFVLFVRMALNAIDGMIARQFNQSSTFGMWFNEVSDIVSDIVLYVPLVIAMDMSILGTGLLPLLIILAELAGILPVIYRSGARRYEGPMGKSDRAFAFGLLAIIHVVVGGSLWLRLGVDLVLFLTAFTAFNRLKDKESQ